MTFKTITIVFLTLILALSGYAQDAENQKNDLSFEDKVDLKSTSVKDQHRTGTCWSFSTLSFLESEMIRLNRPMVDLSPMFVVYHAYMEKAQKYVRMHGKTNFDAGGVFHDVTNVIARYGIVPDEVYRGLEYGEDKHVHGEMDNLLKKQVGAIVENTNRKLSPVWQEPVRSTLDSYLGELPERFSFQAKEYTPQSFAREYVGLNMDDYVEITSFSHHPYYSRFILEIPDNWAWEEVYNVPLEDLEEIIETGLDNGYSFAWASDVSEKGFLSGNKGIAVVPEVKTVDMTNAEITRWENLSDRQREDELYRIDGPVSEMEVTPEARQAAFDNFQTTDDHGMHIIGKATDQAGNVYYKVKNSWGNYNRLDGFFYASKPYVLYKTTLIMIHKDAIPAHIRQKMKI
jgi:bleomycin hydrolase